MNDKDIENCRECHSLGHSRPSGPHLQIGRGKGKRLLVIAESPAKNGWRMSGKAFRTPEGKILATGKRLSDYLQMLDLELEETSFTEMAKCYLTDRKLLEKSCHNCFEFLKRQIKELKPKIVITLGVIPNKVFAKEFERDLPMGTLTKIESFEYLPLYHPSPASPYGHKKNLAILKGLNNTLIKTINK